LIENGIFKMHLNQEYGLGIVGGAIILAAAIDNASESLRKARLARGAVQGFPFQATGKETSHS
jgi:hypothetical protein